MNVSQYYDALEGPLASSLKRGPFDDKRSIKSKNSERYHKHRKPPSDPSSSSTSSSSESDGDDEKYRRRKKGKKLPSSSSESDGDDEKYRSRKISQARIQHYPFCGWVLLILQKDKYGLSWQNLV